MQVKQTQSIIGLITDFGNDDNYVGVVKGVIKGMVPGQEIIDISHGVVSYSVTNAQFCLYSSYRFFPAGTVFYIVVDPAVGTRRRALIAEDGGRQFVAPDNGILDAALSPAAKVYAVREDRFGEVSATFHGRDIFAPVAALLAGGISPAELADPVDDYTRAPFPVYSAGGGVFRGSVVHVDKFGNVITSLPNDLLNGMLTGAFRIHGAGGAFTAVPGHTFADLDRGTAGLLIGSAGLLELAMNCASLAGRYGMKIDDGIVIEHE